MAADPSSIMISVNKTSTLIHGVGYSLRSILRECNAQAGLNLARCDFIGLEFFFVTRRTDLHPRERNAPITAEP